MQSESKALVFNTVLVASARLFEGKVVAMINDDGKSSSPPRLKIP